LRNEILDDVDFIAETDRADLMTVTLSFRSLLRLERHVWIDTESGTGRAGDYSIDLEDWSYEASWDNAVATVHTDDEPVARDITRSWLHGDGLEKTLEYAKGSIVERK